MIYAVFGKRVLDFFLSMVALLVLSPIIVFLIIVGSIVLRGNPFFTQERPGRNERVFNLIKFRTMTNEKDENGEFLPDEIRLIPYGRFLRKTSLDELPELINIVKGDMAIVGPRPLLVRYLPCYTDYERKRHKVRPGLTGAAQISGRNALPWDKRLSLDVEYANNVTFRRDLDIVLRTIIKVVKREGVAEAGNFDMLDLDEERKQNSADC